MHRQTVIGEAGCLFAPGGGGALRLGDDALAHRGGGVVVGLVVEHGREPGAHVMLDVVGEHAQEDMGAHAGAVQWKIGRTSRSTVFKERKARSTRPRLL